MISIYNIYIEPLLTECSTVICRSRMQSKYHALLPVAVEALPKQQRVINSTPQLHSHLVP